VPRTPFVLSILAAALTVISSTPVQAQVRRSAGPEGAPPSAPHGIPRNPRLPFAGVWDGTFTIDNPPDGRRAIPVVMVFVVVDSAKAQYDGATILPNGGRAPHLATAVAKGQISWKQTNSGGGFWMYTGKMVTNDSIAGTAALEDWPQLPVGEKPPTGSIALVRRAPGT
jgi:hypothetical protein